MLAPTELNPSNHRRASGWAFSQFETGAISHGQTAGFHTHVGQ
jgi:hypothetical protein